MPLQFLPKILYKNWLKLSSDSECLYNFKTMISISRFNPNCNVLFHFGKTY